MVRLDVMEGVKHHHPWSNRDAVGDRLSAVVVAAEYLKVCFCHRASAGSVSLFYLFLIRNQFL
jgi:hypothetical protein